MCVHNDGTEVLAEAGDAYYFAPGHDGWVVGDETVVAYEIVGAGKILVLGNRQNNRVFRGFLQGLFYRKGKKF